MIIVSQDKTRTINFDRVEILGINIDDNTKIACCFNDGKVLLGKYKTEERAKEILQEIIKFYEVSERYKCSSNNGITIFTQKTFVYEMPGE